MSKGDSQSRFRSRLKLILVFAMFFGPLIVALVWYYGLSAMHAPRSGTNNAPLITPPVALEIFSNPKLDGSMLELESLIGHWTIVHHIEGMCGKACQTSLYNTRQTRLALGKDAFRMRRILLGQDPDLLVDAAQEHADMDLVLRHQDGLGVQVVTLATQNGAGPDDALLVDPLGNVMMLIPASLNPSDLLKDLKKLMKLSKIG